MVSTPVSPASHSSHHSLEIKRVDACRLSLSVLSGFFALTLCLLHFVSTLCRIHFVSTLCPYALSKAKDGAAGGVSDYSLSPSSSSSSSGTADPAGTTGTAGGRGKRLLARAPEDEQTLVLIRSVAAAPAFSLVPRVRLAARNGGASNTLLFLRPGLLGRLGALLSPYA